MKTRIYSASAVKGLLITQIYCQQVQQSCAISVHQCGIQSIPISLDPVPADKNLQLSRDHAPVDVKSCILMGHWKGKVSKVSLSYLLKYHWCCYKDHSKFKMYIKHSKRRY